MARGRPKKAGPRRKDGRLAIQLPIPANDVVIARREAFKPFQGGKASEQIFDAIGRAWAVGLLDGTRYDSAILRDMGRRYAHYHALVFACTGMAIGELEPRSRGTGEGNGEDRPGERYTDLDRLARNAGSKQRLAMRKLCVEVSPDEDPLWLGRLIQLAQWRRQELGRLDCSAWMSADRDRMILTQAVEALVAMVEG